MADPRVLRRVQAGGTSVHPAPCTRAGDPGGAAPPRPLPRETPRRPHGKPGSLRRAVTRSPRCVSSRGDARPRGPHRPPRAGIAPRARSSTNRAAWRRLPLAPTGPGLAGGPACPASRKRPRLSPSGLGQGRPRPPRAHLYFMLPHPALVRAPWLTCRRWPRAACFCSRCPAAGVGPLQGRCAREVTPSPAFPGRSQDGPWTRWRGRLASALRPDGHCRGQAAPRIPLSSRGTGAGRGPRSAGPQDKPSWRGRRGPS